MLRRAAILFLLAWSAVAPVRAEIKFPALTGRVVDNAGLLGPAVEDKLQSDLKAHEDATREQIVVVTLKTLDGAPIEDFGHRLGRHWGIGQKGKDNGAILLVVPGERTVRIEVGYGLEDRLTDAASATIINNVIVPSFKAGDMEGGILRGTEAIISTLGGQVLERGTVQITPVTSAVPVQSGLPVNWIFWLLVFFWLFRSRKRRRSGLAPFILGTMLSRSGGGSSGGGGGFRGGGGSFGGGGASGKW